MGWFNEKLFEKEKGREEIIQWWYEWKNTENVTLPNDRIFLGRYKQKTQNALPKNMTIKENIKKERATNSCRDGWNVQNRFIERTKYSALSWWKSWLCSSYCVSSTIT